MNATIRGTLYTDMTVKTITADLEVIDNKFNLQIKKSEELAKEWSTHIKKLDAYIESLKSIPCKKLLTYSAYILTIIGFLWKMGMLRNIPSFTSSLAGLALDSSKTGIANASSGNNVPEVSTNISKPSMDSVKAFMESPITPRAFVMGVGSIAIMLGTLKAIV